MRFIHNINRGSVWLPVLLAFLCLFTSCDGFVFDSGEDCTVTYRLRFRYDKNLKWADAFANEVKSVRVYVYDTDNRLVKVIADKGSHLEAENYALTLNLPAGDYHLVGWCGTDNDAREQGRGESFSLTHTEVPDFIGGADATESTDGLIGSIKDGLRCSLNHKSDSEHPAYSDEHLYSVFHGKMDVTLPDADDGQVYDYTMSLTKDTNHVRVVLNHLSGEDVNPDDYVFHIEDSNGLMDAANNLCQDRPIRYRTWKVQSGTIGLDKEDVTTRALITASGAIADLTVGRMCVEHRDEMKLTITNKAGERVASVPVIDCALLAKDYYEEAYGHKMTDQEFLDREDDYVLTFFLDKDNKWPNTMLYIHSWRVVLQDYDL